MHVSSWILLGIVGLFFVPYVKRIVYFPYLYLHEFGHSFTAMIMRVKRTRMEFNLSDGSGSVDVMWDPRNKVKIFFVAIMGYLLPVIVVYAGVWTLQNGYSHYFLIGILLSILYGVLNTKSFVGFSFLLGIAIIGMWLMNTVDWTEKMIEMTAMIITWVVMLGCVKTGEALINNLRIAGRGSNGDALVLEKSIKIPDIVWIVFFIASNFYTLLLVVWLIKGTKLIGMWI